VAGRLRARSVPIVFATGCQELLLDPAYLGAPLCLKPIDKSAFARAAAGDAVGDSTILGSPLRVTWRKE
jgi:hypothetical protein